MALHINSEVIVNKKSGNEKIATSIAGATASEITQRKLMSNNLTSVQKYELEWHDLSDICEDVHLNRLRQISIEGNLKVSKFRSVCWAILLDVLNGNARSWVKQRRRDRQGFQEIKQKYNSNPHTSSNDSDSCGTTGDTTVIQDDPLSQSQQSVWNQHFCDKELCAVIKQDVVRTFPGVDFYRRPAIQEVMINILFCYAREHPEMCYRQGMHEILAPILFVMHCDHQTLLHIQDITSTPIETSLKEVLDPKYMEEDSYFLFYKIMSNIESYYRINDLMPSATGYFPIVSSTSPDDMNKSKLEVVGQLNHIRDKILAKVDIHLHNHLQKLDIPLPIFGIRWLRLLFGREFPLQDLLVLWDAIFAEGSHFELTNFVVVAMLVRIRQKLLTSDYTTCLTYLMKYPGNVDVALVIRYAMHIKTPQLYECPPGAFVQITPIPNPAATNQPQQKSSNYKQIKSTTLPRSIPSSASVSSMAASTKNTQRSHRGSEDLGRLHTRSHDENRKTLTALVNKRTADEQLRVRMNNVQNTTALAAMRFTSQSQMMGDQDPGIIDGFLEDSPEALRCQLQNAYTIMSITKLKLTKYLAVLRKHIPGNSVDEIHQTMDGIEELCSLLEVKYQAPYVTPMQVERAFEVNEPMTGSNGPNNQRQRHPVPRSLSLKNPLNANAQPIPSRKNVKTEMDAKKAFIQSLHRPGSEFEIVVNDDGIIDTLANSLTIQSSSDSSSDTERNATTVAARPMVVPKSRYEIPDDHVMSRKATKILGNRKEVEMHEFNVTATTSLSTAAASSVVTPDYLLVPRIDPSGDRDSPINE